MSENIQIKWDTALYDNKHDFVFRYGEDLVELLQPLPGEHILDLGCGTVYLSKCIAGKGALVTGIDNSADMIRQAKQAYPDMDVRLASANEFIQAEGFDAVFSNAVLHWIKEKEAVVDCMYRNLKTNGRLVLEMGGKQNVAGIIQALKTVLFKYGYTEQAAREQWYFPSLGEYAGLLEKRGFRVCYAAHFDRETPLNNTEDGIRDWLKMFGAGYLLQLDAPVLEQVLKEVEDLLRPTHFRANKWFADYKRLRIVAVKKCD